MLIVSNGYNTDTLVREDAILVKSGMFVYELEEDGVDLSGAFIRDYLLHHGYEMVYSNAFPSSLAGFDAVFASFGSGYYIDPNLSDEIADALTYYGHNNGRIYLEGANAFGYDQNENLYLPLVFGIENTANGTTNALAHLQGMEGSIMDGLEITSSNQYDVSSIDRYFPYENSSATVAFEESDYGTVAVQYESTGSTGQKTFCMSYSLSDLEDGNYPDVREELLNRILAFFDFTLGINDQVHHSAKILQLYPNPASDRATLVIDLDEDAWMSVEIYNLMGQKVLVDYDRMCQAGRNEIHLNTTQLAPGTYIYNVILSTNSYSGKLLIVK